MSKKTEQDEKSAAFSHAEVASLIRFMDETSDRVYALLSGARSMLPRDSLGELDDPSLGTLLDMAMEEVADISYQAYYREKLPPGMLP